MTNSVYDLIKKRSYGGHRAKHGGTYFISGTSGAEMLLKANAKV